MESGKNRIILVTGGSRSGKSAFAESLARNAGTRRFYIATAPVLDEEMAARVKKHQLARANDHWTTIEEQTDLPRALRLAAEQGADAILVDCLTLWLNNLLFHNPQFTEDDIAAKTRELLETLRTIPATVVLVISEVGLGIVPENHLARLFRDASGRCAQIIARDADEVHFTIAGIPLRVK